MGRQSVTSPSWLPQVQEATQQKSILPLIEHVFCQDLKGSPCDEFLARELRASLLVLDRRALLSSDLVVDELEFGA
jgi:hypothetical protein